MTQWTAAEHALDRASVGVISSRASWRWPAPVQLVVLITLTIALFSEPFLHLVELRESNGYAHVEFAQRIAETGVLYPGHFLYHVLTAAIHELFPISWLQAHVVVVLAFRVLLALVIWSIVRKSLRSQDSSIDALVTMILSFGLLVASAISFPSWSQGNYYLGYIVPNIYVSQTLVALQPLALMTFCAVIQVITAPAPGPSGRDVVSMAFLALLSTLAKPSYAMVLLPALGILLLLQRQLLIIVPIRRVGALIMLGRWLRDVKSVMILGAGLVLPTLLAIGWIYFSTYLAYQELHLTQDTGLRIAPFKVMAYFQSLYVPEAQIPFWLLAKFLLSISFPLAVTLVYFSQARRDPRMLLAWLQFAFGLVFMYFFAEEPTFGAGNFTWSGQISMSILFVVSALLLIERTIADRPDRWHAVALNPPAVLCYGTFVLHVVAGYGMFTHPAVN